jgi:hypothetical protein
MAKTRHILDDPANRQAACDFVLSCGFESFNGVSAWQMARCGKTAYFAYKNTHPEFVAQLDNARKAFFASAIRQNPQRVIACWDELDKRLKHGETETSMLADFEYQCDETTGRLILDAHGKPIPGRLIGTARYIWKTKPISARLLIWLADNFQQALDKL